MGGKKEQHPDVLEYWNNRAGLGQWAGTRDVIAKQLEIEAIASYVRDGMSILEFGCGNGVTAIELVRRFNINIIGIDFAEKMVSAAKALLTNQVLKGSVSFHVGNLQSMPDFSKKFDLIYTERVLINLPDWEAQKKAIVDLTDLLNLDGLYIMCENSQDGLDKINIMRENLGLPIITPPWHNRYFRDIEIEEAAFLGIKLESINYYSSTYYFLSRIINASLSAQEGMEPDYEAPINKLALHLPPIGDIGQGRVWVWRKIK